MVADCQINPINSTAGFASAFVNDSHTAANAWVLAETIEYKNNALAFSDKVLGDGLSFSFTQGTSRTSGTWSVTNTDLTKNTVLDVSLSFHSGNNVGSFLFNDQAILAGQTLTGARSLRQCRSRRPTACCWRVWVWWASWHVAAAKPDKYLMRHETPA